MRRPSVGPPSGGAPICFSLATGDFAADAAPAIVCRPTDSKFRSLSLALTSLNCHLGLPRQGLLISGHLRLAHTIPLLPIASIIPTVFYTIDYLHDGTGIMFFVLLSQR